MFNQRKTIEALNYFASRRDNKTISKLVALKLIWLADRYHARQYGRTITGDTCHAMKYGTVPSHTKDYLDGLSSQDFKFESDCLTPIGSYTYESARDPNMKVFSKTDVESMELIFDKFGEMSPEELVDYTHTLPEWKRYELDIKNPRKKNSYPIEKSDIFQNTPDDIGIFNDDEELLEITEELLLGH